MIRYNLKALCKARGINKPHQFLVRAGFARETASRILNGHSIAFRFDHIERLCEALFCEPNDLLEWKPRKDVVYAENFPLKKLIREDFGYEWLEVIKTMPLEELKELASSVVRKKENND